MKKQLLFLVMVTLVVVSAATAQTPIIFRPAAGLNDGTDEGAACCGKDTYVMQYNTSTNYGSAIYMAASPISTCNSWLDVILLKFDVTTLPSNVDSVFVCFTHTPDTVSCLSGCTADFYFKAITQSWNEMTVTYSTIPTLDTTPFFGPVTISFPNNLGTKAYNITSMYRRWAAGTLANYGMAIYSTTSACDNIAVEFSVHTSDDSVAANRPYLMVYPHGLSAWQQADRPGNVLVVPNPADDQANIECYLPGSSAAKYQLTDISGRLIAERTYTIPASGSFHIPVDLVNLPAGLYLYNVTTSGDVFYGKIVHR